jgi:hypothetical protein
MFRSAGTLAATSAALLLATATGAGAQILLPSRPHDTLDFELKSLRDDVTLYMGDPQELLLMNVRPRLTSEPRVTYSGQANAVLQITDQDLIDARGTKSAPSESDDKKDSPYGQKWEVRLSPSGPTSFVLQFDGGESSVDLTDFQVSRVDVSANGTILDVGFRSQNSMVLDNCTIHTDGGSLKFHGLVNAQAKEIALFVPRTECQLEVTGKEWAGESAITLQGVPASLQLTLSKKLGVRVSGPAGTLGHFAGERMVQDADGLVSKDFDKAKCHVRLTIAEEISHIAVKWN